MLTPASYAERLQAYKTRSSAILFSQTDEEIIYNICREGPIEALEEILKTKNKKNKQDRKLYLESFAPEVLHYSCAGNQVRVTAFLLALDLTQRKDRYGYYPIHYACLHEDERKTDLLLRMLIPHDDPITNGPIIANSIGPEPNYETPLHTASNSENQIAFDYFIKQGANPLLINHRGFSLLQEALLQKNYRMAKFLYKHGYALTAIEYHTLHAILESEPEQREGLKGFLGLGIFPISNTAHGHKPLFFRFTVSYPKAPPSSTKASPIGPKGSL